MRVRVIEEMKRRNEFRKIPLEEQIPWDSNCHSQVSRFFLNPEAAAYVLSKEKDELIREAKEKEDKLMKEAKGKDNLIKFLEKRLESVQLKLQGKAEAGNASDPRKKSV